MQLVVYSGRLWHHKFEPFRCYRLRKLRGRAVTSIHKKIIYKYV